MWMVFGMGWQVAAEDWQPVASGLPWSNSCRLVFEMLKESIDLFFGFVPHAPAAMDFCVMLLQHCCECVKHYTWVVRQGTVEREQQQQQQQPSLSLPPAFRVRARPSLHRLHRLHRPLLLLLLAIGRSACLPVCCWWLAGLMI
jgi:hypothetical protein